jgi:hypothetical protein
MRRPTGFTPCSTLIRCATAAARRRQLRMPKSHPHPKRCRRARAGRGRPRATPLRQSCAPSCARRDGSARRHRRAGPDGRTAPSRSRRGDRRRRPRMLDSGKRWPHGRFGLRPQDLTAVRRGRRGRPVYAPYRRRRGCGPDRECPRRWRWASALQVPGRIPPRDPSSRPRSESEH